MLFIVQFIVFPPFPKFPMTRLDCGLKLKTVGKCYGVQALFISQKVASIVITFFTFSTLSFKVQVADAVFLEEMPESQVCIFSNVIRSWDKVTRI